MGQEFQLWAERPRRQSWSPAKRVWNICWGGNDCCSNLLSEFLKYQVLGFPLGLRPSNNSHPVKTRSTGWTISNTMIAITNSVQGHLLCASVGRVGGSCTGKPPPPSTPTTPLLTAPQAGHISIRIYYVINPTTRIPNSSFSSSSQKPHVKWISGTARAIISKQKSKKRNTKI